jgi:hypothetical protein
MYMSGCPARYVAKAVVAHLGAPTTKKSGLFSEDDIFRRPEIAEKFSDELGTIFAPKCIRPAATIMPDEPQQTVSEKAQ